MAIVHCECSLLGIHCVCIVFLNNNWHYDNNCVTSVVPK